MSAETFESRDTRPRAIPVHITDYPGAYSNPEGVITIRVRGHLSADGWGIGGRLTTVMDENGNPYPVVGLDPGSVRACRACGRRAYIPDAAHTNGIVSLPCPFRDCTATFATTPEFGDERFEDRPSEWRGAMCSEHGEGCPR